MSVQGGVTQKGSQCRKGNATAKCIERVRNVIDLVRVQTGFK